MDEDKTKEGVGGGNVASTPHFGFGLSGDMPLEPAETRTELSSCHSKSQMPLASCRAFGLRGDAHFHSDTHVALAYKQVLGGGLSFCAAQVLAPAELLFLVTWAPRGGTEHLAEAWAMVREGPNNEVETGRSKVPKPLKDPLLKEDRAGEHSKGLEEPQRGDVSEWDRQTALHM